MIFWREAIFASDCTTIRGVTDIETIFIRQYLLLLQSHILKQAKGSAQPHVYPSDLKILKYVIPPKKQAKKIEKWFLTINERISNNNLENYNLTRLKDWLLPMLMNGQVAVK